MYTLNAFSFKVLDALNYTDVSVIYDEVMPWSQVSFYMRLRDLRIMDLYYNWVIFHGFIF